MEPLVLIDELDRMGIFVQPAACDNQSLARNRAHHPMFGQDGLFRSNQRPLQISRGPNSSDFTQIGTQPGAPAIDPVAGEAISFALHDHSSSRGIAASRS